MNSFPFFSIILPTYNRANLIRKAIQSVLNQRFKEFELIIVDDGSTDNTKEIVKSFNDPRIRYYWKENEERNISRNYGIRMAKGQYINFLDSDDQHYPNHLEHCYHLVTNQNYPEIIHTNCEIIKDGKRTPSGINIRNSNKINKLLIRKNLLHCNNLFVKNDILRTVQFLNSNNAIVGEDYYLFLRLASRYKIVQSLEVTCAINEHDNRSLNNINVDKLRIGIKEINKSLMHDEIFIKFYGWRAKQHLAFNLVFLSLHLAINNQKKDSLNILISSITIFPPIIFSKRFMAVIKNLLI